MISENTLELLVKALNGEATAEDEAQLRKAFGQKWKSVANATQTIVTNKLNEEHQRAIDDAVKTVKEASSAMQTELDKYKREVELMRRDYSELEKNLNKRCRTAYGITFLAVAAGAFALFVALM